eukprot:SAG31_NODE_48_length_30945_cov_16.254263_5_plen_99_part_00
MLSHSTPQAPKLLLTTTLTTRGTSERDYAKLLNWVSGAVQQAGGKCVSHGRHTALHSALPDIAALQDALEGRHGLFARLADGGNGNACFSAVSNCTSL